MPRGSHARREKVTASRAVTGYHDLRTRAVQPSDTLQTRSRGTSASVRRTCNNDQLLDNKKDRTPRPGPLRFPRIPNLRESIQPHVM